MWVALLLLTPSLLAAQDPRLAQRLDAPSAAAVQRIVDDARAGGLPTEPLVLRALEGATRAVPGPRIVAAVGGYAERLGRTRDALGAKATEGDLVAGASALYAGVTPEQLAQLRTSRHGDSIVLPASVIVDLVNRGVPPTRAAAEVLRLTASRPDDAALKRLNEVIRGEGDATIPASALSRRVSGILATLPPPSPGATAGARLPGTASAPGSLVPR